MSPSGSQPDVYAFAEGYLADPPLALDALEDQLQVWHCPHLGSEPPSMICWCLMSARHSMIARLKKVHEVAQGLCRPLFASYLACLVQQSFTSTSAEPGAIALSGGICHPSLGSSWPGLGVAQTLPSWNQWLPNAAPLA